MGGTIVPKYNYGCEVCKREWMQWSSMNNPAVECPHCFSKRVKRLPSNFNTIKAGDTNDKTSKENVIDHIEENREILKKMRHAAKNEDILKDD